MITVRNSDKVPAVNLPRHTAQSPPTRISTPEAAPRSANLIALIAGAGIAAHLLLRFVWGTSGVVAQLPLYFALLIGGVPLLVNLSRKLWALEFGSDFLAGASILTAVLLHEYLVATIVVLMLSGGTALEEFATRRASHVLDALAKRMPNIAHRRSEQKTVDVTLEDIQIGDTLAVLPHEICPVD